MLMTVHDVLVLCQEEVEFLVLTVDVGRLGIVFIGRFLGGDARPETCSVQSEGVSK